VLSGASGKLPRIQGHAVFPLWIKIPVTLFLCVFLSVYWSYDGPLNFLWFSNLCLIGAVLALWLENRILASMMLLMTFAADFVGWDVDFLLRLLTGWHPLGATRYMFDPRIPLFVRGLSLYHPVVPALLAWMVYKLGYDKRALLAQTLFGWILLLLCYAFTDPALNINVVFGLGAQPQTRVPPLVYLAAVMLYVLLAFYVPIHLVLRRLKW
jgi:hypothetical protein